MKIERKFILILIILFLNGFSLFSFEFDSPFSNFRWTLDMTMGMQNIMSKENGSNVSDSFVLETSGLIFHSYFKNRLLSSATLDLGFVSRPDFLWTNSPNFMHDDSNLNENLKSIQLDYQIYLPKIGPWFLSFLPFGGFSFVNLSDERFYGSESFNYFSLSAGVQYFQKVNKRFSHTYYISYSPMIVTNSFEYHNTVHYVNYGAEFIISLPIISFNLFLIVRKVYEDFNQALLVASQKYTINTTEIGFSFKVTLF